MQKIITKKEFETRLKDLFKEYQVVGPKELLNKGIFYGEISNPADLYWGAGFAVEPLKKFFLEPCSLIFKHLEDNSPDINSSQESKKRIIIGSRPCETRGLALLDKIFDVPASSGGPLSIKTVIISIIVIGQLSSALLVMGRTGVVSVHLWVGRL